MKRKGIRILCMAFALVICLGGVVGCQKKGDPLAKSGFEALTVDSDGRVSATVTLDLRTVEEKKGERAYFYELLPGETTETILQGDPLDIAGVGAEMQFQCPLTDENGRSRLYSSFFVIFQDGTLMNEEGFYIENPQRLATDRTAFAWESSIKAIGNSDADVAAKMKVLHVSYEVTLSELMNGTESFEFCGNTYTLSAPVLAQLDKQILSATNAGMQVSLVLKLDSVPSAEGFAAVADKLASRYGGTGAGRVSAILLCPNDLSFAADACRISSLAFRSRIAEAQIFVTAPKGLSVDDTEVFFADLQADLTKGGELEWGAAVIPSDTTAEPWEASDASGVTVASLPALSEALFSMPFVCRASRLAVYGVAFDATEADLQAAAYAYTYRIATRANVSLLFYMDGVDPKTDLHDESGEERRIVSVLSDIDAVLLPADEKLCATVIGEAWETEPPSPSRFEVSGTSNVGSPGLAETLLFDFTMGDCYGFTGVGNATEPESHPSAVLNAPVLYTWISPTHGAAGGVRKVLKNADAFDSATSLSFRLLTQIPNADEARVTLLLDGLTESGDRVSYERALEIANGGWQTVTFGISAFVSELDPSKPCILTLTTEPIDAHEAQEYVLWVSDVSIRYPEKSMGAILPLLVIVACVSLSCLSLFLLYRRSLGRVSRRRRR